MISENAFTLSLQGNDGQSHQLSEFKGKYLVVYFYPKDATPGCTIQGHEYTKLLEEFKNLNAQVVGVSTGSVESKIKFAEKQKYQHLLLADVNGELGQAFDVIKHHGLVEKIVGSLERSSFIFAPDQKLIKENRNVKYNEDANKNLAYLKSIISSK